MHVYIYTFQPRFSPCEFNSLHSFEPPTSVSISLLSLLMNSSWCTDARKKMRSWGTDMMATSYFSFSWGFKQTTNLNFKMRSKQNLTLGEIEKLTTSIDMSVHFSTFFSQDVVIRLACAKLVKYLLSMCTKLSKLCMDVLLTGLCLHWLCSTALIWASWAAAALGSCFLAWACLVLVQVWARQQPPGSDRDSKPRKSMAWVCCLAQTTDRRLVPQGWRHAAAAGRKEGGVRTFIEFSFHMLFDSGWMDVRWNKSKLPTQLF